MSDPDCFELIGGVASNQRAQLFLVCVQVLLEKPTLAAHWLACTGSVKMMMMMMMMMIERSVPPGPPSPLTAHVRGLSCVTENSDVIPSAESS
jgi:hypothetical protein